MNSALTLLCIAPFAPPVNHAEPIQVGRYLKELLRTDQVKLVSKRPSGSWSVIDPSPIWPTPLKPQHETIPLRRTAHAPPSEVASAIGAIG